MYSTYILQNVVVQCLTEVTAVTAVTEATVQHTGTSGIVTSGIVASGIGHLLGSWGDTVSPGESRYALCTYTRPGVLAPPALLPPSSASTQWVWASDLSWGVTAYMDCVLKCEVWVPPASAHT
ncbi:hypothetical protein GGX14DRAFT_389618 [Mycena pura]|uniref:Uncharacterized protein n=1 Tax=Mycena pura TaxID=153505 RepID=A0AAD6VR08_9AGAR|nr:hypothetical protein GGX14DRAFT_389618 [Mycena pura]